VRTKEGAQRQGQRIVTTVVRHVDHTAINVITASWWDIIVKVVLDGKEEI
jgi:hypothetical protein